MNSSALPKFDVTFALDLNGIDWSALKVALAIDDFENGRSPEQLRRSFENSFTVCIAHSQGRVVGTARVLSDGICNAYLVDVWTESALRRRGIAKEMIQRLCSHLSGQHVYLQADDDIAEVYRRLGFRVQPLGMSIVVGQWLINDSVASNSTGNPLNPQ